MFSKGTGCCAPSSWIDWWRLSLSSTSSQRVRWRHCSMTSCWPSSGTRQRQCTCWAQSMMRPPCMSFSGTDQMPSSHPVLLTKILRWVLLTNRMRWLSPTMPPGKLCGGTRSRYPSAADFPAEYLFSAWERWRQVGLSTVPGICYLGSAHFWYRKTCRSPGARWHQHCTEEFCHLKDRHFIMKVLQTEKRGNKSGKRCTVCSFKGVHQESTYTCVDCPSQPGLCVMPCFKDYHTKISYWQWSSLVWVSGLSCSESNTDSESNWEVNQCWQWTLYFLRIVVCGFLMLPAVVSEDQLSNSTATVHTVFMFIY